MTNRSTAPLSPAAREHLLRHATRRAHALRRAAVNELIDRGLARVRAWITPAARRHGFEG